MNKVAIIQARMGSSRFPGKVLEKLGSKVLLQWVVDAANAIPTINKVVVATSDQSQDQLIVEWCEKNEVSFFKGNESDVLSRFYHAAKQYNSDVVIRLTADCPFLDPAIAAQVLTIVSCGQADYASNVLPATWPDGLDCEAFTMKALEKAFECAEKLSDREHVTPYITNNQYHFKVLNVCCPIKGLQKHRWTVDTREDLEYLEEILSKTEANPTVWTLLEVIQKYPELRQPLSTRNEGFEKSLKSEDVICKDFYQSQKLLKRSLKTIPLGCQTFSKSYIQYPENTSPMFLTHGSGSRVWDVDGNQYIDLVSGLLPIVLGYNDPDVNEAIQRQLSKGISFSLATELEIQLAEKLCRIIPSAEKVRFAKNGTDVTSAAIRLARAYTGRDKVMVCGYHGWQDWYIGTTTRNKGVPKAISDLSMTVSYNDLNQVERLLKTEEWACIILEPCNITAPQTGYLKGVKDLCEKYGSILIFDEVITGFRFSLGGAQEYFGVTPHLSCFGKAMGNGMPISAIVGQKHVMKEMEEIFFSSTFGGETLSLAASMATIEKIEQEKVIDYLWNYGGVLARDVEKLLSENDLVSAIKVCGHDVWKLFQFLDHPNGTAFEIKTFFIQEMIARGILINSSVNINFAHKEFERHKITQALSDVFQMLSAHLKADTFQTALKSPAIQPLFKVR